MENSALTPTVPADLLAEDGQLSFVFEAAALDLPEPTGFHGQYEFAFKQPLVVKAAGTFDLTNRKTKLSFRAMVASIKADFDKRGAQTVTELTNDGHRVFEARSFNDDVSVEADYGAPAQGLTFFKDLIDPTRSFRYTRLRKLEGVYRTHFNEARKVGAFLKARGYKMFNGTNTHESPPEDKAAATTHVHFCNGGVTRGFTDIARHLVQEESKISATRKILGTPAHKAVFLMPTPTYGLFYYVLRDILAGTGIDLVTLPRNDNGSVNLRALENTLLDYRLNGTRVIGYYDCNPHNPTGYIRDRADTLTTAKILMAETDYYRAQDDKLAEGFNYSGKAPENVSKAIMTFASHINKPQGGIVIIDDMAYEGLELVENRKPFSFGQISVPVAEQTLVLKGISKIGLPGARIGLMIGHHELLEHQHEPQLENEFSASTLGVDLITARYSHGPQQKQFLAHAKKLRHLHRHNAAIVDAFINGLDDAKLTHPQKSDLAALYAQTNNLPLKTAYQHLRSGLPGFYVNRDIQSGFFMNLDVSNLKGRPIAVRFDKHAFPDFMPIETSYGLYSVFKSFGINVVPAGSQGGSHYSLNARITLSLKHEDLITLYARLRDMHAYFFGQNPAYQLDLFRQNLAAKRHLKLGL